MDILVTGAPGWLGTRLTQTLCRGLDGDAPAFPKAQVRCLVERGRDPSPVTRLGAVPVEGDLTKPETLGNALEGADLVFHIAGVIHPTWRTADFFKINTVGTGNLLAASAEAGVKRFCYVSSNSVGGLNLRRDRLMTEDDPPRPYMAYGRSKFQAEQLVRRYHQDGVLETVTIRPCWYYGPSQPLRQTRLFKMIKTGRPIIFGDGKNRRSLSYLDNVVHGLILAAKSENAIGQTYWLADERPYETIEIYRTVAELLGVDQFRPRFVPNLVSSACAIGDRLLQAAGIYQAAVHIAGELNEDIACSIEKATKELGYDPAISLKEGLRRSIDWCRRNGIDI